MYFFTPFRCHFSHKGHDVSGFALWVDSLGSQYWSSPCAQAQNSVPCRCSVWSTR